MTVDLEELKRLAEAALWTGDWYDAGCGTVHCTYVDKEKFGDYGEVAHPEPTGVSAFIAAANPRAVLALLSELAALRKLLDHAIMASNAEAKYGDEARQERDRLRKELEEAKRQYNELIFAVGMKHPNESRHETALRYIRQVEMPRDSQLQAARQQKG